MKNEVMATGESGATLIQAPVGTAPSAHEMASLRAMAAQAVQSGLYKCGEAELVAKMLIGRELGIPPMMALNGGVHNIKGKAEVSARSMMAMIRRAGHSVKIVQYDRNGCILEGTRSDNGDMARISFDLEDAKLAGLLGSEAWRKYPRAMCFARATSELARVLFSDVIGTAYVEGEVIDGVVPVEVREAIAAEPVVDGQAVVAAFVQQYPAEERPQRASFLERIADSYKKPVAELVARAAANLSAFDEQFAAWRGGQQAA